MKKNYQKPEQKVIRMESQQFICYSGGLGSREFEEEEEQ